MAYEDSQGRLTSAGILAVLDTLAERVPAERFGRIHGLTDDAVAGVAAASVELMPEGLVPTHAWMHGFMAGVLLGYAQALSDQTAHNQQAAPDAIAIRQRAYAIR